MCVRRTYKMLFGLSRWPLNTLAQVLLLKMSTSVYRVVERFSPETVGEQ